MDKADLAAGPADTLDGVTQHSLPFVSMDTKKNITDEYKGEYVTFEM